MRFSAINSDKILIIALIISGHLQIDKIIFPTENLYSLKALWPPLLRLSIK